LGQFNLPVTITPTSNKIFFIDPVDGNDAFPGTAAQPWQTVENALKVTALSGSKVALAASSGNDVVVTILAGSTQSANAISTPNLPAGSVTVLKAPSAGTFTLNMGNNKLTLNKGYKLQDINIISSRTTGGTAVEITHPTAGLANVDVTCNGTATNVICVQVVGPGLHTLKDVTVKVAARSGNVGIQSNANANLSIVGGEVRLTGNVAKITLIESNGVLIATGLTVDMTDNNAHTQNSTGIVLNAAGSSVTGSTIKVNSGPTNTQNAIGIEVQSGASKSTVEGNTFKGYGNSVGVSGNNNLSSDALSKNTFVGSFTAQVQP
jgi:hypothetical protein